jgi:enoyl-CoA hydratase/carnithine racemase
LMFSSCDLDSPQSWTLIMTLPSYPDLQISLEQYIATVEFSAGVMNFLGVPLLEQLVSAWEWADNEPECRVILLCSAGRVFSAGANFMDFMEGDEITPAPLYQLALRLFKGTTPVIAAIQGAAVGAGLGLAMVADARVAGPKAKFLANFVKLGFHPGFGLTASLPRVIGAQHTGTMLMSAKSIGADEALQIGLVDECAEEDTLRATARARARLIAHNAPMAVQSVRQTLREPLVAAVASALEHELETQLKHFRTEDFSEGVRALLEKREPQFTGA